MYYIIFLLDSYKIKDLEVYTTIEEQEMFRSCYPDITEKFDLIQEQKQTKKGCHFI